MSIIVPVTTLLNVLGTILEARGQDDLGEYAKLASSLLQGGDNAMDAMTDLTNEITAMVQEGRNPTPDEIQAVRNKRQALSDAIQNRSQAAPNSTTENGESPGGTNPE